MKKTMTQQHKHKPLRILQVFHNYACYGKEQNNSQTRSVLTRWYSPLVSTTGFLSDGVFFANEDLRELLLASNSADTLLLNDYNDRLALERRIPVNKPVSDFYNFFSLRGAPHAFEIFTLRWSALGFELWLDYQNNSGSIGRPRRNNFKVAHLEQGRAVRVSINGKFDVSLSGHRPRTYVEREYLFLYQGETSCFEFQPATQVTSQKFVPVTDAKHVDLRALLY